MGSIDKACISGFLCRLCSEMHRTVIHIYGEQGKKHRLVEKINGYLPITVSPHDPLPKTICETCLRRVEQHYELLSRLEEWRENKAEKKGMGVLRPRVLRLRTATNNDHRLIAGSSSSLGTGSVSVSSTSSGTSIPTSTCMLAESTQEVSTSTLTTNNQFHTRQQISTHHIPTSQTEWNDHACTTRSDEATAGTSRKSRLIKMVKSDNDEDDDDDDDDDDDYGDNYESSKNQSSTRNSKQENDSINTADAKADNMENNVLLNKNNDSKSPSSSFGLSDNMTNLTNNSTETEVTGSNDTVIHNNHLTEDETC